MAERLLTTASLALDVHFLAHDAALNDDGYRGYPPFVANDRHADRSDRSDGAQLVDPLRCVCEVLPQDSVGVCSEGGGGRVLVTLVAGESDRASDVAHRSESVVLGLDDQVAGEHLWVL